MPNGDSQKWSDVHKRAMNPLRLITIGAVFVAVGIADAQSWSTAYDEGLKAGKAQHWAEARQAFLQAAAIRPEDASAPTILPGPIGARPTWRDGAPYSPNFLAAFAAFKSLDSLGDTRAQNALLSNIAEELQVLIDKGQACMPTLAYLNAAYERLGMDRKAHLLSARVRKFDWRVDTEVVDPDELRRMEAAVEPLPPPKTMPPPPPPIDKPVATPTHADTPAPQPILKTQELSATTKQPVQSKPAAAAPPSPKPKEPLKLTLSGNHAKTDADPASIDVSKLKPTTTQNPAGTITNVPANLLMPSVRPPAAQPVAPPTSLNEPSKGPSKPMVAGLPAAPLPNGTAKPIKAGDKTTMEPKPVPPKEPLTSTPVPIKPNSLGPTPQPVSEPVNEPKQVIVTQQTSPRPVPEFKPLVPAQIPKPTVPAINIPTRTETPQPVHETLGKFALVIGNSECRIPGEQISFAANDAQQLHDALIVSAGYRESNMELALNATSKVILAAARSLANRMAPASTVLIYFAGVGANVDGHDVLAGAEALSFAEAGLVSKNDLYKVFIDKGIRIFAFFETNRTMTNGRFFGLDTPATGSIAQSHATMPGDNVSSFTLHGKQTGVYTHAFMAALAEMKSEQLGIGDFGWKVFYRVRDGDNEMAASINRQTPTLPILSNMDATDRF